MNTRHKTVLVTRFNWPHPNWTDWKSAEYVSWLDERIEAFSHYTLASVRNCYEQPDDWFILINAGVGRDMEKILSPLLVDIPHTLVRFRGLNLTDTIRRELAKFEYPLTLKMMRLDSDDLVANSIFAIVKNLDFSDEELARPTVVSFPGGSTYVAETEQFFFSSIPANPFLVLVEQLHSPSEARTVYFKMHTEMLTKDFNVKLMRSSYPIWASIVHSSNTENQKLISTCEVPLGNTEYLKKRFGLK